MTVRRRLGYWWRFRSLNWRLFLLGSILGTSGAVVLSATHNIGRFSIAYVPWVVIWDGHVHAFIEDTLVANRARRQGIGKRLLSVVTEQSRQAGCEWLHVDFDEHLKTFYLEACGFRPTNAGLIQLR